MEGIDETDRKILYYLDMDARMPVKKIAKLIKEKSEKINYRVKRLFRERIIKRCYAEVDPWKTGQTSFKVYFQFQGVDKDKIEEMYGFLKKNCNIGWAGSCLGRWDMIVEIIAHDRHEFTKYYSRFHEKYYEYILNKVIGVTLERIFVSKRWLAPDIQQFNTSVMIGYPEKDVDDKDVAILLHLTRNGRDPVNKISQALGMPPTTISQRIANLRKKGIIPNFRIDLDLKKFNRVYCKSFIYFSMATDDAQKRLIDFCIHYPEVVFITKCIAPWDMEIEAMMPTFNEFTDFMNDLHKRFPDVIRNFETAVINRDTGNLSIPGQ